MRATVNRRPHSISCRCVLCRTWEKISWRCLFLFFVRASFLPSSIGTNVVVVVVVVGKCENILYKHTAEQNRAVECGIGEEVRVSERERTLNRTNNVSEKELYGNFVVYTLGEANECCLPYTEHSCASFIFVVFLTHSRNFVFLHKPVLPDRDRYQNAAVVVSSARISLSFCCCWMEYSMAAKIRTPAAALELESSSSSSSGKWWWSLRNGIRLRSIHIYTYRVCRFIYLLSKRDNWRNKKN